MPKINTNFYNPQTKGRVVYPKEMVEAIRKNTIVLPNGERISRAELEQAYAANKGTLTDLGDKPSTDTRTSTQRNADYLHPIKGIVERQKSEWDNGKHPVQGLAKTVGASALIAAGAGYSSPIVNTFAGLGKNIVAGALGTEGFTMLDGRLATPTELATGAIMEMGMPMIFKGSSKLYGKMFNNKTNTSIIENVVQEATPIVKKENIYQNSVPFKIEQPTTNTLQLKSTMMGSPLEKQLSKDGMLSINSLQAHLNNQSTSIADRTMIQKVLNEKFAGQQKINYNDFRKAVSDEMVPLKKNFDSNYSNYGVEKLGYSPNLQEGLLKHNQALNDKIKKMWPNRANPLARNEIYGAIPSIRANKKELINAPIENTSIIYSNKEKFGRGSTDHFQNEGALGHSRILVSKEEPDIMHILEQQSDYYQKDPYSKLLANKQEAIDGGYDQDIIQYWTKKVEDYEKGQINPIQKELLGKTHQERLLQENVAHAAQNGQTKMRYPTPETAAKIQGYKKIIPNDDRISDIRGNIVYLENKLLSNSLSDIERNSINYQLSNSKNTLSKLKKESESIIPKYSSQHETILKKYADNPKMIKKILGQDTRTVTDSKGNSWYEFDIPEAFRKGKAEIKALSTIGAIATGYKAIADKNKNK